MTFPDEVLERFQKVMREAEEAQEPEPSAMTLATLSDHGGVSIRTVLLKAFDARGFVFYTNTLSNKGRQMANRPQAALCLLWKRIYKQVQVEGIVEHVTQEEADAYFATRARGSQIGAWASLQSQPLDSRTTLEGRVHEFEVKFSGVEVPRPPHWSGYRLLPSMIEFWYGKESRLHDRFRFTLQNTTWQKQRLYP